MITTPDYIVTQALATPGQQILVLYRGNVPPVLPFPPSAVRDQGQGYIYLTNDTRLYLAQEGGDFAAWPYTIYRV